ncbi:acyl-CoA Delta-9 desaturase [Eupeodes corollae]|uniref:acyl-CoA Delta-9 desaturase n=1 Tax=Eupeodes corollae TaxID=290404 RepID=UPI0024912F36|nr:acyl-CoA Delta-9 desaturase [Eupeodes corollae]XP_055921665.1 acyl-CoA Delta-9 desaturase [Eupeodes corollae]
MGHLSTSDRVNTSKLTANGCAGTEKDRDSMYGNNSDVGGVCNGGSGTTTKLLNAGGACTSNGYCANGNGYLSNGSVKLLNNANGNGSGGYGNQNGGIQTVLLSKSEVQDVESDGSNNEEDIKNASSSAGYFEPTHNINLEEYTKNFSGDSFMGYKFLAPLKWDKIIQITLLHMAFLYGLVVYDLRDLNLKTTIFAFFTGGLAGFGVTGGVHRLWTHKSFKANVPLRVILMACFSLSGQNTIYDWVRDHRVHHKFSETDADPHNSNRGFFFAHVGWLMMLKHPEVLRRGRQLDMSDVLSDPVVQFHQKHFILLKLLLCFLIPTMIPVYCWDEKWYCAFLTQCIFRYVCSLNFTWSVNSAAHMWGARPYDKRINPSENLCVSIVAMGEGWHNYHHVFPWDYKAAELGKYSVNLTTFYLDMFAKMGWAWDMKQPSKELVRKTIEKYGDGTHFTHGHVHIAEIPDPSDKGSYYDQNKNFKDD